MKPSKRDTNLASSDGAPVWNRSNDNRCKHTHGGTKYLTMCDTQIKFTVIQMGPGDKTVESCRLIVWHYRQRKKPS